MTGRQAIVWLTGMPIQEKPPYLTSELSRPPLRLPRDVLLLLLLLQLTGPDVPGGSQCLRRRYPQTGPGRGARMLRGERIMCGLLCVILVPHSKYLYL